MLELAGKFMLKTNSGTEKHQTVAAVSLVSDAASSPDWELSALSVCLVYIASAGALAGG